VLHTPYGTSPPTLAGSPAFENVHAWAITSSPLILSFDLTITSKLDLVWIIVTNREVLAVNEA
jgi:hypothetical protein